MLFAEQSVFGGSCAGLKLYSERDNRRRRGLASLESSWEFLARIARRAGVEHEGVDGSGAAEVSGYSIAPHLLFAVLTETPEREFLGFGETPTDMPRLAYFVFCSKARRATRVTMMVTTSVARRPIPRKTYSSGLFSPPPLLASRPSLPIVPR